MAHYCDACENAYRHHSSLWRHKAMMHNVKQFAPADDESDRSSVHSEEESRSDNVPSSSSEERELDGHAQLRAEQLFWHLIRNEAAICTLLSDKEAQDFFFKLAKEMDFCNAFVKTTEHFIGKIENFVVACLANRLDALEYVQSGDLYADMEHTKWRLVRKGYDTIEAWQKAVEKYKDRLLERIVPIGYDINIEDDDSSSDESDASSAEDSRNE